MKFSIVTPSFNQGHFISQTIDSVVNQVGDFEIEYFVMDGGSTDNTIDILKKYDKNLKNNSKIKFFWQSKKDKGQSDAINQGFSKATGDIFAFINSDDYYQPNTFNTISKIKQKSFWATGYSHIVNENNQIIQKPITLYKNFFINHYLANTLLILNFISQPSTFFTKDLFRQFNSSLHLTMDYDYWLYLSTISNPFVFHQYFSNFRIHSSSKGKSNFIAQFNEDYQTAKKYTTNYFILFLHHLHNSLIVFIYKIIK